MKKDTDLKEKTHATNILDETLREGARKLLQQAIEAEVEAYTDMFKEIKDEKNRRSVVRNGYLPERSLQSGLGPISVRQPRVRDNSGRERFTSAILPKYARKTPSVEAVIPTLYLKGLSTGDFSEALAALLGENAQGLSPTTICRLKESWQQEYKQWSGRDLSDKRYVYVWADGIYFNVRLDKDRPCVLVLIGTLASGKKEIVAIHDGHRESKLSWKELLLGLKERGLTIAPSLAIGDGALGFWSALEEVFTETAQQRCWVHKTANVLDKMPKSVQGHAKSMIHDMYLAPNKDKALKSFDAFLSLYEAKYAGACKCLKKNKEQLFAFYDFPAEHWQHLRTTNPIESTFATIRHRTRQTKGCGSRTATLTMVFKLALEAEKHWYRLRSAELIEKVIRGVKFIDGEEQQIKETAA